VGQALGDGVEVLLEAPGEGGDAGQAGGLGVGGPLREVLAGEPGHHDGERADLVRGGLELRTA
jgi:hypothetical protein